MKKRIFIAINLPENIKNELLNHQKRIDDLFTPYRNGVSGMGPIRLTEKENLHITLIFIGYINEDELLEIFRTTKEIVSRHSSFSLNLNRVFYGPPNIKPPRMVWVEGEKVKEMSDLKNELEKSLTNSGINFSPEDRDFHPHITLGRIKTWEWRRMEPEEIPEIDEEISLTFNVNSIEIMESKLKRGGAEYMILESAPLSK